MGGSGRRPSIPPSDGQDSEAASDSAASNVRRSTRQRRPTQRVVDEPLPPPPAPPPPPPPPPRRKRRRKLLLEKKKTDCDGEEKRRKRQRMEQKVGESEEDNKIDDEGSGGEGVSKKRRAARRLSSGSERLDEHREAGDSAKGTEGSKSWPDSRRRANTASTDDSRDSDYSSESGKEHSFETDKGVVGRKTRERTTRKRGNPKIVAELDGDESASSSAAKRLKNAESGSESETKRKSGHGRKAASCRDFPTYGNENISVDKEDKDVADNASKEGEEKRHKQSATICGLDGGKKEEESSSEYATDGNEKDLSAVSTDRPRDEEIGISESTSKEDIPVSGDDYGGSKEGDENGSESDPSVNPDESSVVDSNGNATAESIKVTKSGSDIIETSRAESSGEKESKHAAEPRSVTIVESGNPRSDPNGIHSSEKAPKNTESEVKSEEKLAEENHQEATASALGCHRAEAVGEHASCGATKQGYSLGQSDDKGGTCAQNDGGKVGSKAPDSCEEAGPGSLDSETKTNPPIAPASDRLESFSKLDSHISREIGAPFGAGSETVLKQGSEHCVVERDVAENIGAATSEGLLCQNGEPVAKKGTDLCKDLRIAIREIEEAGSDVKLESSTQEEVDTKEKHEEVSVPHDEPASGENHGSETTKVYATEGPSVEETIKRSQDELEKDGAAEGKKEDETVVVFATTSPEDSNRLSSAAVSCGSMKEELAPNGGGVKYDEQSPLCESSGEQEAIQRSGPAEEAIQPMQLSDLPDAMKVGRGSNPTNRVQGLPLPAPKRQANEADEAIQRSSMENEQRIGTTDESNKAREHDAHAHRNPEPSSYHSMTDEATQEEIDVIKTGAFSNDETDSRYENDPSWPLHEPSKVPSAVERSPIASTPSRVSFTPFDTDKSQLVELSDIQKFATRDGPFLLESGVPPALQSSGSISEEDIGPLQKLGTDRGEEPSSDLPFSGCGGHQKDDLLSGATENKLAPARDVLSAKDPLAGGSSKNTSALRSSLNMSLLGRNLDHMKMMLYVVGARAHRCNGYERIFANYWAALALRLRGGLTGRASQRCRTALDSFLTTKKLRKLHNGFIKGLMERCLHEAIPKSEISEHIPSLLRNRIRISRKPSFGDARRANDRQEASDDSLSLTEKPVYVPLLSEVTEDPVFRMKQEDSSPSQIPGALDIDPFVRKRVQQVGMRVTENVIWLLVVAMKEYTSSLLSKAISASDAIQDQSLLPDIFQPSHRELKKYSTGEEGESTKKAGDGRSQKCITAMDITAFATSVPMSSSSALGGSVSRLTFEHCLGAAYDSGGALNGASFTNVHSFITSEIRSSAAAMAKKIEPPAVHKKEVPLEKGGQPASPEGLPEPPQSNLPRRSAAAPASMNVDPSNRKEKESHSPEPDKSSEEGAKPNPQEVMQRRTTPGLGGLGRGAKDLAALRARAQTSKREPEATKLEGPLKKAATERPPEPPSSLVATVSAPNAAQLNSASSGENNADKKNLPAPASSAPLVVGGSNEAAVRPEEQQPAPQQVRRGMGFGVKNLAAMRARATTTTSAVLQASKDGEEKDGTGQDPSVEQTKKTQEMVTPQA